MLVEMGEDQEEIGEGKNLIKIYGDMLINLKCRG